jgi:hypothetical protein
MLARPSPFLAAFGFTALVLLGGAGTNAMAQQQGVHVDPDSPSGKEYKLPLDDARRDAAGGIGSGDRGGGKGPPLFGAGISKPETSGTDSVSPREGHRDVGSSGDATGKKASSPGGRDDSETPQAVAESGDGLSPLMLTALIALGVLLLGAIVGFSLRAIRGTRQPT